MANAKAETKKPSTEVAEKPANTQLATAADLNFEADAGLGTEGVDKDSQAIPFLAVLQALSPAVADGTVEGAKPGMLMNTVTNELMDSAVIVPVAFQRRYVEWAPRKLGGGYKGEHMPVDVESGKVGYAAEGGGYFVTTESAPKPLRREEARDKHHALKDTRSHFVFVVRADGTFFPAMMPLASTQIKKSKKLMSMVLGVQMRNGSGALFNPPSFSHMYKVSTVKESNDQGTWHGVQFEPAGRVSDPELYAAAKAFHAQIMAGKVQVAQPDENVGASDDGGAAGSAENF